MNKPNFVIAGVQKAGTTSVYNYLSQHPEVYMSPVKETNFFERDWEVLPDVQHIIAKKPYLASWENYLKLFAGVTNEIAIGEVSPNYLLHYECSMKRIQQFIPEAKIIFILRNPIQRAYSDYLMHIRDAVGTGKNKSLIAQIQYSGDKSHILLKGLYSKALNYFYQKFDRNKIAVYLYDDLARDSLKFMQEMYKFLEVNPDYQVDVSRKLQTAAVPKNQAINNLLRRKNSLRTMAATTLKLFLPSETRQKIRNSLITLNSTDKKSRPLTAEEKAALKEYYQSDIEQLQDLLNKDLSHWLA